MEPTKTEAAEQQVVCPHCGTVFGVDGEGIWNCPEPECDALLLWNNDKIQDFFESIPHNNGNR
jgi:hypothetical protein